MCPVHPPSSDWVVIPPSSASSEPAPAPAPESPTFTIHTSQLFDPLKKAVLADVSLTVSRATGLITSVEHRTSPLPDVISTPDIDLRGLFVLPGLVDAHTHIFLHGYAEAPSVTQMRDESLVERTLRAANNCRVALLAGYTTYRDLGTEGAASADINMRDAINRGLIPGPRLFVATECIASSSSYTLHTENALLGHALPRISDAADGTAGVRAAVRRRIGVGADVLKFYADYRRQPMRFPAGVQFPPAEPNPHSVMFTIDEMRAMVDEAHAAGIPVAVHAQTQEGAMAAVLAGVDTVEHGQGADGATHAAMAAHATMLVASLSVLELYMEADAFAALLTRTRRAWEGGVRLALGGDTGAFPHGENVHELELHVRAGIPVLDVLAAATRGGWEACGGDRCGRRFGWVAEGCAADLIGLRGDPREALAALRQVEFVMKDARVWKMDGAAVGMV